MQTSIYDRGNFSYTDGQWGLEEPLRLLMARSPGACNTENKEKHTEAVHNAHVMKVTRNKAPDSGRDLWGRLHCGAQCQCRSQPPGSQAKVAFGGHTASCCKLAPRHSDAIRSMPVTRKCIITTGWFSTHRDSCQVAQTAEWQHCLLEAVHEGSIRSEQAGVLSDLLWFCSRFAITSAPRK